MSLLLKGGGVSQAAVDSTIATHAALATVHQDAPTLIDADVATHAALATVHQDAPTLIDADVATHAALDTAVHGSGGSYLAYHPAQGIDVSRIVWLDPAVSALSDLNRTATLDYTDLDLSSHVSAGAKFVYVLIDILPDTVGSGNQIIVLVHKNGGSGSLFARAGASKLGSIAGVRITNAMWVELDEDKIIEYRIHIETGWQIDTTIAVIGYAE